MRLYSKYFSAGTMLLISISAVQAEDKLGKIWNYNPSTGGVTVIPPVPGYFNIGDVLHVFTEDGKPIGKIHVNRSFHTKVDAVSKEKNPDIDRSSIVVKHPKDFAKSDKKRPSIISYRDIENRARGWSVKVQFSGKTCSPDAKTQARKLDFANAIGYRETGNNYYRPVKLSSIESFMYTWDGQKLAAKSLKISGKTIETDEIISSSPLKMIKPPSSCRDEIQDVSITLKKSGSPRKSLIDVIPLEIKIDKPSKLKGHDAYIIKIFSNQKFLADYIIDYEMMKRENVSGKINLPVYYFSPGMNQIEAVLVGAKADGRLIREDRTVSKIGSSTLNIEAGNYNHSLAISGRGKRLKMEVK